MNERLKEAIDKANKIVFLTGAGISVPSGLPQFEGSRQVDAGEAYEAIREELDEKIRNAEPSTGHKFIADLFAKGKDVYVLTQNVDSLHQKAGLPQERVFELHGNHERGDTVEFGMTLPEKVWDGSIEAIRAADLFIVIGTSLKVSPVNYLPQYAMDCRVPVWIINKTETALDWGAGPNVIHDDLVNVLG